MNKKHGTCEIYSEFAAGQRHPTRRNNHNKKPQPATGNRRPATRVRTSKILPGDNTIGGKSCQHVIANSSGGGREYFDKSMCAFVTRSAKRRSDKAAPLSTPGSIRRPRRRLRRTARNRQPPADLSPWERQWTKARGLQETQGRFP